jgi:23S rRNA (adenine2503-C2)-methyltransferase
MGFQRDLTSGEMVSQVLTLKKELGDYAGKLNLVFMGMGEPLLNYDNLARALGLLCAAEGLNISPRHVTVSTAGILENLEKLERDFPNVKIAFSLNAPTASLRAELMPVSHREHLDDLLVYFRERPRRQRITFEYVLLGGVNDSDEDAVRLSRLVKGIPAKVNLIPYNENPGLGFRAPEPGRVEAFQERLVAANVTAVVRRNRGRDIAAACGQLAGRTKSEAGAAPGSAGRKSPPTPLFQRGGLDPSTTLVQKRERSPAPGGASARNEGEGNRPVRSVGKGSGRDPRGTGRSDRGRKPGESLGKRTG